MDSWSTIINFMLLTILFFLYITSVIFDILKCTNEEQDFLFYLFIFDSIFSIIMTLLTLLLGFVSIYFSSKEKLLIYIIILCIAFCIKSIVFILLYRNITNINDVLLIFIISIIEIVIIALNFISALYERNLLIKEIEESPLNYVDETITEEMYNSILSQCLNPDDKKLKKEFQKKMKKRKKQISHLSLTSNSDRKE